MIVGVDLSLSCTGVCVAGVCDTITTKTKGMDRLHDIRMAVLEACDGADLVVIEGYSYASAQGAHQLGELGGIVRYALWDCSIPYVDVAPKLVKKFATNNGNANKNAMIATAARLGCPADDDNAVDAWWLWQLGIYPSSAAGVPLTSYRADCYDKIDWPTKAAA